MLVIYFILLGLFQQIYSIEQSFRCLIKQKNTKIIFANLTFKCDYSRIYSTGCLTAISTDTIALSNLTTQFANTRPFIAAYESFQHSIISIEFTIMKIEHKNYYKRNREKIKQRKSKHKIFHLGLPILINPNTIINSFILSDKLIQERLKVKEMTNRDVSEHKRDNISVNYLLPLTYEITKSGITGFRINNNEYELVFCKEILKNKEENLLNKKLLRGTDGIKEAISNEERKYIYYEDFVKRRLLKVVNMPKQRASVLFVDRLNPTRKSIMNLIRTGMGNLNIWPNFDGYLYLTLIENMWHCVDWADDEPIDEKVIRGYNNRFISDFVLKKIYNKGGKIRMFK